MAYVILHTPPGWSGGFVRVQASKRNCFGDNAIGNPCRAIRIDFCDTEGSIARAVEFWLYDISVFKYAVINFICMFDTSRVFSLVVIIYLFLFFLADAVPICLECKVKNHVSSKHQLGGCVVGRCVNS